MSESLTELDGRQHNVLMALIRTYVSSGLPVSSSRLSSLLDNRWSSATIRNDLSQLSRLGYLEQAHCSAGRKPSTVGYRYYTNQLKQTPPLESATRHRVLAIGESGESDASQLLRRASRVLSECTRGAGLALTPSPNRTVLRHIEFLLLEPGQLLALLVCRSGTVYHKRLSVRFPIDRPSLTRMNDYLNSRLSGLTLQEMRDTISAKVSTERVRADSIARAALTICEQALPEPTDEIEFVIEGRERLLGNNEFGDSETLRGLVAALEQRAVWLKLLDSSLDAPGVRVFIGNENRICGLEGCTVITATYGRENAILGTLGVIGPVRMIYERTIPLVNLAAQVVSKRLTR